MRKEKTLGWRWLLAPIVLASVGCSSVPPTQAPLIRSPEILEIARAETDYAPLETVQVAYATDRERGPDMGRTGPGTYQNERGMQVWLGFGELRVDGEKQINLVDIEEHGVLLDEVVALDPLPNRVLSEEEQAFYQQLNAQLAQAETSDLVIYISGFRVPFTNPLLVSGQLTSLIEGAAVFLGYSWPSTPSLMAYLRDIETAEHSSRSLRLLIEHLAKNTNARQIHILGYSAGTRLVARALHEITLLTHGNEQVAQQRYKIGHVAMVSSDMDRELFGSFLADDIGAVTQSLTVYRSKKDGVLGLAGWIFNGQRLGRLEAYEDLEPELLRALLDYEKLDVIDVSDAPFVNEASGHGYFLRSPWVSSDVLLTILTDLQPSQRGLIRESGSLSWTFPPDYPARLRQLATHD